jgi:transcription elongation GreA/GreB family factor
LIGELQHNVSFGEMLRASGALLCASIACIALDTALERVVFEDLSTRYKAIADGVTYGDSGDARVQKGINDVLALIEESMENGRVVARQAKKQIDKRFDALRADILAEHFSRSHNSNQLVQIACELEAVAHQRSTPQAASISADARALLGVLADFVQIRRHVIIGGAPIQPAGVEAQVPTAEAPSEPADVPPAPEPGKLL